MEMITLYIIKEEIFGCYEEWSNGKGNCVVVGKDGCWNCIKCAECRIKNTINKMQIQLLISNMKGFKMIKPNVLYLKDNVVVSCDKHWLNGNCHTDTKENGCWNCQWKCTFKITT